MPDKSTRARTNWIARLSWIRASANRRKFSCSVLRRSVLSLSTAQPFDSPLTKMLKRGRVAGLFDDIREDGDAGDGMRVGVGFRRRDRLGRDRHRVLCLEKPGWILDLGDLGLDGGQHLVAVRRVAVQGDELEFGDKVVRLAGVVNDLIPQVPDRFLAAAGDVRRQKAGRLELEIERPHVFFVLDVVLAAAQG